jgi:hypothetical protein
MVLIELFVLKLALDGILQNAKEIEQKNNLRQMERDLKSQLSQLVIDYHKGIIDQNTYNKKEYEILSNLSKIPKQYNVS